MKTILLAFALIGCSGDDGGTDPQGGAFGATCTVVTDNDTTECESGVCTDSFDMLGHDVCSLKCTMADPSVCPEGSEGKKCNMKGYCKP